MDMLIFGLQGLNSVLVEMRFLVVRDKKIFEVLHRELNILLRKR